jgi:tetratricopeptide (TPR) repeat protein
MAPPDCWQLENEAIRAFEAGDIESALDLFLRAADGAPDPRIHFNLALAFAKAGSLVSALEALEAGLELEGGDGDRQALKMFDFLYRALCEEDFACAEQLDPRLLARLHGKYTFTNFGDPTAKDAIEAIFRESCCDTYPPDIPHSDTPNSPVAFEKNASFGEEREFTVAFDASYRYMALPVLDSYSLDEIIEFIQDRYNSLPESEKATALLNLFARGKRLYEDSEYAEAARIYEALADVEPENVAVLLHCGRALRDSGELDLIERSVGYFLRIVQLNNESAPGWYDLSIAYAILGDFRKELFCLSRAIDFGHTRSDFSRVAYLQTITAPEDPFG